MLILSLRDAVAAGNARLAQHAAMPIARALGKPHQARRTLLATPPTCLGAMKTYLRALKVLAAFIRRQFLRARHYESKCSTAILTPHRR